MGHTAQGAHAPVEPQPARWRGRFWAEVKPFVEIGLFVLPALLGPAAIAAYVVGKYHVTPFKLDGKYFPDGGFLFDLHVMWKAGHDIVTGHSPYPFVYPAPAAFLMVPFGLLPWKVAVAAFSLFVTGALFLTLRLLGVRDWRCYGAACASAPFVGTIAVGTLSAFLALCAALAWRYRDRRWIVAIAIVGAVATKIFLWPLVVWLVATRRFRSAATTVLLGIATVFGFWGAIGFSGLTGYVHFMRHVAGLELGRSYSSFAFFSSLGASDGSARLAVVALTLIGIVAILAIARGADGDRRSFVAAIAVALLVSPIVWLHYMILLYVVVALYRRRLSVAWLIPSLYWILPGEDSHGSTAVIVRMWLVTGLTVVFALFPSRRRAPQPALASR